MKLIYKLFSIPIGLLAGFLSKKVFEQVWGVIDDREPPKANTLEATWPRVVLASSVQGLTFYVTRAVVQRAGAKSFTHLTGVWPGERRPDLE